MVDCVIVDLVIYVVLVCIFPLVSPGFDLFLSTDQDTVGWAAGRASDL